MPRACAGGAHAPGAAPRSRRTAGEAARSGASRAAPRRARRRRCRRCVPRAAARRQGSLRRRRAGARRRGRSAPRCCRRWRHLPRCCRRWRHLPREPSASAPPRNATRAAALAAARAKAPSTATEPRERARAQESAGERGRARESAREGRHRCVPRGSHAAAPAARSAESSLGTRASAAPAALSRTGSGPTRGARPLSADTGSSGGARNPPAAGPDADAVRRGGGGAGCRARARHRAWGRHLQRERGALPRGRPRRLLRAICAQRKRARALDGARDAVNFPRRCQLSDRARSARDALGALVQRPAPRVHRAPRSESLPVDLRPKVAREEGSALDMQEGRTARGEGVA